MLTYAHVCSRMLTYAHVCSRMLTYADLLASQLFETAGKRVLAIKEEEKEADVCRRTLTSADVS